MQMLPVLLLDSQGKTFLSPDLALRRLPWSPGRCCGRDVPSYSPSLCWSCLEDILFPEENAVRKIPPRYPLAVRHSLPDVSCLHVSVQVLFSRSYLLACPPILPEKGSLLFDGGTGLA